MTDDYISKRDRVLLVIDTLGSGGAQRQLSELSSHLARNNFDVLVIAYYKNDFYVQFLRDSGVSVCYPGEDLGRIQRFKYIFSGIKEFKPSVVCAFLSAPGLAVELCRVFFPFKFRVVVSERHSDSRVTFAVVLRLLLHVLSNAIVANSETQRRFIFRWAPWLRAKLFCIRNCVDLDRFSPREKRKSNSDRIKILVLASYTYNKNTIGLIKAVRCFLDDIPDANFLIEWYGNPLVSDRSGGVSERPFEEACALIKTLSLERYIKLEGQRTDTEDLYRNADLFCLPSFSEATPNVICEAMASGVPIIASAVGDIADYVQDDVNGFLFDPENTISIATALKKFYMLGEEKRILLGKNNRDRAVSLFGFNTFVNSYIDVFALVRK